MDFYFAIVDSKKFDLQIPSFIILITPVVINLVLIVKTTFGDENFRDWFKRKTGSSEEHGSSEEAGLSKETLKLIIWAGFLMFIIEDVPQLIIQVIYKLKIVNYNIIPFITLTISSLIIISGAFSKLSACC
ncbi:hypothetical protein RhiirB3_428599 [Rhizophagus irregularis]|nr:hypothetical protein RhiirB3_428599 [Rhizophagus irregularis]